jgi:Cu-Zn family superoxide dismutase
MKPHLLISSAILGVALAGPASADAMKANAMMKSADGTELGNVSFAENGNGVLIRADLAGLPPGLRAFHLHETASCDDGFKAAGGHYAPEGNEHGTLNPAGAHAGDLPNIWVADDGRAVHHVITTDVTLAEGATNSLFDEDGSSVIIHENPDSYEADAGAGGRIAWPGRMRSAMPSTKR